MRRRFRSRLRQVRSLRGWWAVALVGWLYGLPGFVNDGRWWWGALGNHDAQRVAFLGAGAVFLLVSLTAIRRLDRVAVQVARSLRS